MIDRALRVPALAHVHLRRYHCTTDYLHPR